VFERDVQSPFILPPGARLIMLVRHGSADNGGVGAAMRCEAGRWADPELTERGNQQAKLVASRLSGLPQGVRAQMALFSSGLRRADATAAATCAALGLPMSAVIELREISLGSYEGPAFEAARAAGDPLMKQVFAEERWDVLTGAEDMGRFATRVRLGLAQVIDRTPVGHTAVIFTHGGVVAELCHQVTGSRPFAFINVENGSLTTLIHSANGGLNLRSFNDTAHLDMPRS